MRAKAESAKRSRDGNTKTPVREPPSPGVGVVESIGERQAPSPPLTRTSIAETASSFAPVVSTRGEDPFPSTSSAPPPTSSSAVFSGSIMEREILERPVIAGPTGTPITSAFSSAPRTSRFAGNNPDGDRVTLEPVGEPVRCVC
jgi:hypothetical protein